MKAITVVVLFLCASALAQFPFPGPGRAPAVGGGGGGGQSFSDDFDRTDSASLGGNWTEAAGDMAIFSNTLRQVTASYGAIFTIYSATATDTVDQYLKVTFTDDGGEYPGVVLRYQNSSSAFYVLYHDSNAVWEWYSYPSTGGGSTLIGSGDSGTFADGNSYGITITGTGSGTEIRIWKNPTANSPVSATEWDSGDTTPELTLTNDPGTAADVGKYLGLTASAGSANIVRLDNFYGGDIP